MYKVELKVEKLPHCSALPEYKTSGASGMDLSAGIDKDIVLKPMERKLIPTGIKIEVPMGFEAQVRPRSGMSIKQGLTLVNCTGTIDADYRGEIKVPMINLSGETQIIKNGDRIAQMVIMPIAIADIKIVDELSQTLRGEGGFGSTGFKA